MGKEQSLQEAHLQGAEESMSTGMFPKGQECVNYLWTTNTVIVIFSKREGRDFWKNTAWLDA